MTMRRRQHGLSLIEVLASVVLVAVVMPVAMRCISLATNASSLAVQRMHATTLAEQKLGEILAAEDYLTAQEGDFGEDWPAYTWSSSNTDFDVSVVQVDVTVSWIAYNGVQDVTLSTMVYTDY